MNEGNIMKLFLLLALSLIIVFTACESLPTVPPKEVFSVGPPPNDSLGVFPNGYEISDPYPNPFNNHTSFSVSIPKRSFVSVVIQNPLGDIIKVVFSQEINPGRYLLDWDATNEEGDVVEDGFYFITMQTDGFIQSTIAKVFNP